MCIKAIKGRILYFTDDPYKVGDENACKYLENGAIIIENGLIKDIANADTILKNFSHKIETYGEDELIMPGFIDTHVHFPQTQMIAAYGKQLLDWLNNYTFVTEAEFSSFEHAQKIAKVFFHQLIKNGVTTALAYASVHPQSVDAYFSEASKYGLRMIGGKVFMSQNAPQNLCFSPEISYKQSEELIQKWHKKGRNLYALTPRFAITCPEEELQMVGDLFRRYEDVYLQTHLSENKDEIEFTKSLFADRKDYTDIYDYYGLLSQRSVFGHCIHLSDDELLRLAKSSSVIAHCPTSNLFLGSGLLDLAKAKEHDLHVSIGSDVGAGTSFSPLQTLNEAYKIAQLQNHSLSSIKAFYLLTLGNAKALRLEDKIGSFAQNSEADIVVLSKKGTDFMKFRQNYAKDVSEELFIYMMIGDDRSIKATYSMGNKIYCDGQINYIN